MLKVKTKKDEPMEWMDWVLVMSIMGHEIQTVEDLYQKIDDDMLKACYKERSIRLRKLERKLYKLASK